MGLILGEGALIVLKVSQETFEELMLFKLSTQNLLTTVSGREYMPPCDKLKSNFPPKEKTRLSEWQKV